MMDAKKPRKMSRRDHLPLLSKGSAEPWPGGLTSQHAFLDTGTLSSARRKHQRTEPRDEPPCSVRRPHTRLYVRMVVKCHTVAPPAHIRRPTRQ
jgi:hypothetical protein